MRQKSDDRRGINPEMNLSWKNLTTDVTDEYNPNVN